MPEKLRPAPTGCFNGHGGLFNDDDVFTIPIRLMCHIEGCEKEFLWRLFSAGNQLATYFHSINGFAKGLQMNGQLVTHGKAVAYNGFVTQFIFLPNASEIYQTF